MFLSFATKIRRIDAKKDRQEFGAKCNMLFGSSFSSTSEKRLKRKSIIIFSAAVLIIVIIGGYLSLVYYIDHPSLKQVRDMTIAYIKAHHKETGQYMQSFSWTGKDITPEGWTGSAIYSYQSSGWNITLQYATGLPPSIWSPAFYNITATFTSKVSGNVIASWQGELENGMIAETFYKYSP